MFVKLLKISFGIYLAAYIANLISYKIMKKRILQRKKWDLNICCGHTNGGGINADIVKHSDVPNFVKIDDIYKLPFSDKQFKTVLCSHTIEHVDNPEKFLQELYRVGEKVTVVLPPLWDFSAAFNLIEHKWLFLTMKKEHSQLPLNIKLPIADLIHNFFGQKIKA